VHACMSICVCTVFLKKNGFKDAEEHEKNDHAPLMISIMCMLYRRTFVVVVVPFIPAFHHYISFL
jgi:hypothetical protein